MNVDAPASPFALSPPFVPRPRQSGDPPVAAAPAEGASRRRLTFAAPPVPAAAIVAPAPPVAAPPVAPQRLGNRALTVAVTLVSCACVVGVLIGLGAWHLRSPSSAGMGGSGPSRGS